VIFAHAPKAYAHHKPQSWVYTAINQH